jgi:hypothetical protein
MKQRGILLTACLMVFVLSAAGCALHAAEVKKPEYPKDKASESCVEKEKEKGKGNKGFVTLGGKSAEKKKPGMCPAGCSGESY